MDSLQFLLIDDHNLILDGLEVFIKSSFPNCSISRAGDKLSVYKMLDVSNFDIIILDLNLHGQNMMDELELIIQKANTGKVIILTSYDDPMLMDEAINKCKAKGYLLKNTSREEFIFAIKEVLLGNIYLNQRKDLSFNLNRTTEDFEKVNNLTVREKEILKMIAQNYTNKKISEQLFLSIHTIKTHRKSIFKKLQIHSAGELVSFAHRNRLMVY